jgi:sterol 3beta-glucosyltransferase
MGIPAILGSPFPMNKTQEYLSVISYGRKAPTSINKSISYKMVQGMLWLASSDSVKGYWKNRYHKLPDNFSAPYERVSRKEPAIISCSNFVFPRPADWDENIHQYGYWFVKEPKEFTPPAELANFLDQGDKPVYFGFGSVFNEDKKDESVKLIVEALGQCKMRGIISGMGDIENLPAHIIAIGSTPHSWLFDKCAAVCHHGGAGTTAAGFKAGVPSIVIPFANDQFAWAHRAYDLGVGAKPIYRKNLTASDLARAIQSATNNDIIQNARKLGENISAENGALGCARVVVDALKR